jgi:copper chaperone CopZ
MKKRKLCPRAVFPDPDQTEEEAMAKLTLELPTMYADHHVIEVRRILLALPGVQDVYASSAFRVALVTYDAAKINDLEIQIKLDEAGYLGEWSVLAETGQAVGSGDGPNTFLRHTAVYEQVKHVISFAQNVSYQGRPLWPCPGMGPMRDMNEEN